MAPLLALLLSPLLLFPLGPDQSAFYIGGGKILRGAVYYRDIIDVKPPLIHHLYALAMAIFGEHGYAILLCDALAQGATCWLMVVVTRRLSGSLLWGYLSAVIYILLYVGLNFQNVAQPESYVGLIGLAITWLLLEKRTRAGFIAVGALAGILFLLKFTLGIILAAALLGEILLFRAGPRALATRCLEFGAGFLPVAGLLLFYILANGVGPEFAMMRSFTGGYARLQLGSPGTALKNMLKLLPRAFSELYSILLFGATTAGMAGAIPRPPEKQAGATDGTALLLRFATITFVLLLGTVCLEGRYYPYQFSRIYPFGALLAGHGLIAITRRLQARPPRGLYRPLLIGTLLAGAVLYGPLIRYGWWSLPMGLRIVGGEEAYDRYYGRLLDGLSRTELRSVGQEIDRRRAPGDQVFAASNVAGLLYYQIGYFPKLPVLFSPSIAASFAPEEWRNAAISYLMRERPRFIITQRGDDREEQTGIPQDSEQTLRSLPGIDSLLNAGYRETMHTEVFHLYERREP